ncbi:hypothetical protein CTP10_R57570 [Cupriavidus sp. P-10]|uniref:hypothetical protein n=1 Tax=unclassified Cupriavidus TaxID=2640874 RepID=UPI000ED512C3|nr:MULTISPECIES: hypothetical protein [unclassified Cupriavidus]BDB28346.1 hypothetical protein CTP10_R57570 [Cupriavidus sp. P-10]
MHTNEASAPLRLIEVWGDTADTRHLAWSIVIGAVVSLGGFLVAARLLAGLASSPELARAYAMLAGLGGCLLAGVICAVLFRPKRQVIEGEPGDPRWRDDVLATLAGQPGGLGSIADLPAAVRQEMKELQLYDLFASHEHNHTAGNGPPRLATPRTAVLADPSA